MALTISFTHTHTHTHTRARTHTHTRSRPRTAHAPPTHGPRPAPPLTAPHRTQHMAYRTRHTAHGTRHTAHRTRHMAHRTRHTTIGTPHTAHNTHHTTQHTQHTHTPSHTPACFITQFTSIYHLIPTVNIDYPIETSWMQLQDQPCTMADTASSSTQTVNIVTIPRPRSIIFLIKCTSFLQNILSRLRLQTNMAIIPPAM